MPPRPLPSRLQPRERLCALPAPRWVGAGDTPQARDPRSEIAMSRASGEGGESRGRERGGRGLGPARQAWPWEPGSGQSPEDAAPSLVSQRNRSTGKPRNAPMPASYPDHRLFGGWPGHGRPRSNPSARGPGRACGGTAGQESKASAWRWPTRAARAHRTLVSAWRLRLVTSRPRSPRRGPTAGEPAASAPSARTAPAWRAARAEVGGGVGATAPATPRPRRPSRAGPRRGPGPCSRPAAARSSASGFGSVLAGGGSAEGNVEGQTERDRPGDERSRTEPRDVSVPSSHARKEARGQGRGGRGEQRGGVCSWRGP